MTLLDPTGTPLPDKRIFFMVLITLRNCSEWIDACLDSLLKQTFPSWNAIVCDDASTDDSFEKIVAKVGEDPRFTLVKNDERRTALPNLMDMIRIATGDYMLILDGDDMLIRPDALDLIYAVYLDCVDLIATSGQYVRWPDGGIGHCRPHVDDWFQTWPFGHTLTFSREVCLQMMDEFPEAYLDPETGKPYLSTYDLALFYPIVAFSEWNSKRIAHINTPTYLYRRWSGNDDATPEVLHLQSMCARKIQLYWLNKIYQHEREERERAEREGGVAE